MEKSCYFKETSIFGLSSSAIEIMDDVKTILIRCVISSCTSSDGAGIHIKYGSLWVNKTCIEKCRATVEGSAIRSYCDTWINLSSISRCAETVAGIDDTVDIEGKNSYTNKVNCSNSITAHSIFQLFGCLKSGVSQCLFAQGKSSNVVQYYRITEPVHFEESVITNNTASVTLFLIDATRPLYFRGSVFSGNKSPKVLFSQANFPEVIFENVVIMENFSVGYDVDYSTETDHIPKFDEKRETFICYQKELEIITLMCKLQRNLGPGLLLGLILP